MAELWDGFIALPGGIGTREERFEVWTWAQLGTHAKPCAMLNGLGFYDGLLTFLDHVVGQGFLKPIHREMLIVEDDQACLLQTIARDRAQAVGKWVSTAERREGKECVSRCGDRGWQ